MGNKILSEIDFKEESILVAKNVRHNSVRDNYFQNSIENLNRIQDLWKFDEKDGFGRCGFDYEIQIYEKVKPILKIDICFNCESLRINKSTFRISQNEMTQLFERDLIKANTVIEQFKNRKEGRQFWKELDKNEFSIKEDILRPRWVEFDGDFEIQIQKQLTEKEILNNDEIRNEVSKQEDFLIQQLNEIKENSDLKTEDIYDSETSNLNHGSFLISNKQFKIESNHLKISFYVNSSKGFYDKIDLENKGRFDRIRDIKLELMY